MARLQVDSKDPISSGRWKADGPWLSLRATVKTFTSGDTGAGI